MAVKRDLYRMMRGIEDQLGQEELRNWIANASTSYGILLIREEGEAFIAKRQVKGLPRFVDFLSDYLELRFCSLDDPVETQDQRKRPFEFEGDEPCEFTLKPECSFERERRKYLFGKD